MENKLIARTLRLTSQLMELHDDNAFKAKSLASAAYRIDKLPFQLSGKSLEDIEKIESIGKSTAAKLWALLQNQSLPELSELLQKTPPGIVEMMRIKGLGPKKIAIIWKDLGIESVGELYYACNENRLVEAKGFGQKTQDEVKKAIEFAMASGGQHLYAQVEAFAEELLKALQDQFGTENCLLCGDYRRRCETLKTVDVLLIDIEPAAIRSFFTSLGMNAEEAPGVLSFNSESGVDVRVFTTDKANSGLNLIKATGNDDHVSKLELLLVDKNVEGRSEEEIYSLAGLAFIEPELRECLNEIELAATGNLPQLLTYADIKGALHNHSTWSDGVHSIEEMALYCRDELGFEYLGLCDHSKSAFYANGLNEVRVAAQQREIDALNEKLGSFVIFKGIESDILFDGTLDYSDEVLATFDFVVASIHSNFKMSVEKATERLIRAIENPYTTILGHPTGRLLLSRNGYTIDYAKVIDACAANNVIIEINSNPLRLDLDWRWHRYALEKGVMLSINPDAHRKERFIDMHYGALVARKGGVPSEKCLNTLSADAVRKIFEAKKKRIEA